MNIGSLDLSAQPLLIIGFSERFHMGAMLKYAAEALQIPVYFSDARKAYDGNWLLQRINWRWRDRQPVHLADFEQTLIETCRRVKPSVVLVTGITPPLRSTLEAVRDLGITCVNFLTDDPWNPNQRANWFLQALPSYDLILSPRRANLDDLERLGCRAYYLPFAYDTTLHHIEPPSPELANQYESDVLFYGGADNDRLPYVTALIEMGLNVHLYGGYWNRNPKTRACHKGMADAQTLRWATSGAKVTLCLVRRANRDGHVMRSFESPAMGACLLVEDTAEHREIFGAEWENVAYFRSILEMREKVAQLMSSPDLCLRLRQNVHRHITQGGNAYENRLGEIMERLKGTDITS